MENSVFKNRIKIHNTEDLFTKGKMILQQLEHSTLPLVQNDQILTKEEVIESIQKAGNLINKWYSWMNDLSAYMLNNEITSEEAEAYQKELDELYKLPGGKKLEYFSS